MIFISGSATLPGITMVGSSPGCQRSMLPGEPSDEPKNSVEVFTEKPSRGAACSSAAGTSPDGLGAPADALSGFEDGSYCFRGGAASAACNSGSSGACSICRGSAAVFAPITDEFEVAGSCGFSSDDGAESAGEGGRTTRRSPFSVRSTLGKSEA
jgi:hypothetical protein